MSRIAPVGDENAALAISRPSAISRYLSPSLAISAVASRLKLPSGSTSAFVIMSLWTGRTIW